MTLNASALTSALQSVFAGTADANHDGHPDGTPVSPTDAGQQLAKAYADYASAALFSASTPTFTGQQSALASTLGSSLPVPGLAATHAAAWSAGLTVFWLAVPVAGAQVGATVGCPGAAALTATLTAIFANLANTAASCASALASALHTATLTVTAAVSPPPGTVLPIS